MEEKRIKRWLKRKVRVTFSLLISFLICGTIGFAEETKPTESKAVILGKDAKIGNKHVADDKTEGVAIGDEATIDSLGGNGEHYSVAIGRKARVGSNGLDFSSIALGDNAYVLNGSGLQEWALSFDSDNFNVKKVFFKPKIEGIKDKTKVPGGIAIGTNSYARTGSIQLGAHTYSGTMGGIDINNVATNKEANIINMTTIGTNSYQKAAMGTMVGAYNISTGDFTGEGGMNSFNYGGQNFGSSIFGTLNSIRSKGNGGTSGVANSIFGIANTTENSNGSLVFGAGNVVKNSNDYLKLTNALTESFKNVDEGVNKFQEVIQKNNSGGATLVIGGANRTDYTKKVTIIGINNEITGTKDKKSESEMVLGSNNKVMQASNGIILGTNYTVEKDNNILLGFNKEENKVSVGNVLALGNDIKATTDNSVYLGNESQNADNYRTIYGNKEEYTGILKNMYFAGKTDYGIFSIGSEGKERVLQNVAPGLISDNSTDAINGSQLSQVIKNSKFYITKDGQKYEIKMGDTLNLDGTTPSIQGFRNISLINLQDRTPSTKIQGLRNISLNNLQDRTPSTNKDYLEKEKEKINQKYVVTGKMPNDTLDHYYNEREFSKYRVFFDPSQSVWNDVAPATIVEGEGNDMFRNVFATVNGRVNKMDSSIPFAGVANSITGVANTVENSNGTLIYGAGNKVSKSYLPVDVYLMALAYSELVPDPTENKEISEKQLKDKVLELVKLKKENPQAYKEKLDNSSSLQTLAALAMNFMEGKDKNNHLTKLLTSMINEEYSGGSTLVIGGGNEANTTKKTAIVGAANVVKNAENTFVTGFNNKVLADDNEYEEKGDNNGEYIKVNEGYVYIGKDQSGNKLGKYELKKDKHIENNIITGSNYTVTNGKNILLGFNKEENKVDKENIVALGNDIKATTANSIYLGNESANSSNSIWNGSYTKQEFANNNDLKNVFNGITFAGTTNVNGIVSIGKDNGARVLQNVAAGKIESSSTDAINGSQFYALAKKVNELSNGGVTPTPPTPPVPTPTTTTLNYVTLNDKKDKVNTSTELTNITFDGMGVKVEEKEVKSKDDDNKTVKVHTIKLTADGEIAENGDKVSHAVSGKTVFNYIKNNMPNVTEINNKIEKIDKKSDLALGGVSNAVAMANLPQVNSYSRHRHNLSAAYGYYSGSHALALGFSGVNEKRNFVYKLSGAVNNKGNLALGIGAGIMLGKEDNDYPVNSKKVEKLEKANKELMDKVSKMEQENMQIKEMLNKLLKK